MNLYDVFSAHGVIIRRTSGSTPRHALADVLGGGGTPRAVKRNRQFIIAAALEYPELGTATYRGLVAVPVDEEPAAAVTLTAAGLQWAMHNAAVSITARIALRAYAGGARDWSQAHRDTAIAAANAAAEVE